MKSKKSDYKKLSCFIAVLSIMTMAISTGCVDNNSAEGSSESSVSTEANEKNTELSKPEETVTDAPAETTPEETVPEKTTEETETPTEESNISIVSHSIGKDYEGKDVLIIEYAWTNTDDDATSFSFAVQDKVYQNGIECSSTVIGCDEIDSQQQLNDVQPGTTYNLKVGYVLQDMTNANVVVTKTWSDDKLLDEIIELGGGEGTAISVDESQETSLKITNHYLAKDYEDKDVLIVEYEFYNGEDDAEAFMYLFDDKVFQNGVECDSNVFGCDDITSDDMMNKIQPGVTITIREGYHISDMSDVSVEVTKLFGNTQYLSETLTLS